MKTNVISVLVHGDSKVGKSTFTFTAPPPLLVLDAEGSTKFIKSAGFRSAVPMRKIYWDPLRDAPPRADGTWEVCVVQTQTWDVLTTVLQHLTQSPHDFRSVSLDSITEIQRKLKKALVGTAQMQLQNWGELLTRMDDVIRAYRDLTLLQGNPVEAVVFVAESRPRKSDNKMTPYMQGQVEVSLPYWVDLCMYMYTGYAVDPQTGQASLTQAEGLTVPTPQQVAGERLQGALPHIIANPHLTDILNYVYGSEHTA